MDILVLAKHVPETAQAELTLIPEEPAIDLEDLVFDVNEWDLYAIEAALQLAQAHDGSVTVMTMGDEEAEDTLRKAMAMGCAKGIHLDDEDFLQGDGHATAKTLSKAIQEEENFDLILCGVQASDDGLAWTGPAVASYLDLPCATMVTSIEKQDQKLKIRRELEGGTEEELFIDLPCVLTIQTGINEPRYVSIMGIRKVRKKPITQMDAEDLDLDEEEIGISGSRLQITELSHPTTLTQVEFIEGTPSEMAKGFADLLLEKGGLK